MCYRYRPLLKFCTMAMIVMTMTMSANVFMYDRTWFCRRWKQGGHFPVLIKFPDFSRYLRHASDGIQIGLGVLVTEQESTCEYILSQVKSLFSIGKTSFCLLLWQSVTLTSSALNRTQAVTLCLFCDHCNHGNTLKAEHIFPDFFHVPWLFQVFEVGGRPAKIVCAECNKVN